MSVFIYKSAGSLVHSAKLRTTQFLFISRLPVRLARDSFFSSSSSFFSLAFFKLPLSSPRHPDLHFSFFHRIARSAQGNLEHYDRVAFPYVCFEISLLWHVSIRRSFNVPFTYIGYKIIDKNLSSKSTISFTHISKRFVFDRLLITIRVHFSRVFFVFPFSSSFKRRWKRVVFIRESGTSMIPLLAATGTRLFFGLVNKKISQEGQWSLFGEVLPSLTLL